MGYYSEVAIAMKKKDFNEMESAIYCHILDKDLQKLIKTLLDSAEKSEVRLDNDEYLVLKWPYVKWYSCFSEIKFISDYLLKLPQHDFIRIGEDPDDTEVYHGLDSFILDIERYIVINE